MTVRRPHAILTPSPASYVALTQPNPAGVPNDHPIFPRAFTGGPHGQA